MVSAYRPYQERMAGESLPPMELDYAEEIKNYPTWVLESAGRIVGGITMMFESNYASIANVAVDPACQGQGFGSRLLRFGETQARQNHYTEIRLATHILLGENISLYQHLGWSECGRDEMRVYMIKDL